MSIFIQYLLKLSISLVVVWTFYHLVLRKLTFYNSNRWYLLGYTLLSFLIPFINITPIMEKGQLTNSGVIQFIPVVETYTVKVEGLTQCPVPIGSSTWDKWDWTLLAISIGAAFLFLRFLLRCISYLRLRSKATLLWDEGMKLYHVNESIIPFSFGNSVFINRDQHNKEELQEIIRHEFVHVKQRHTIDILWGELLCMLNWYNPFAWLLRADMRQNLEFIADNKVLENGVDKKEYQYLLLKVIGNNHFSIAQKFNFSSLKKRIAMMNKIKTARVHLLRFLFILPLLAVILISFRKSRGETNLPIESRALITALCDTVPPLNLANEKGYIVRVTGSKENAKVIVKDQEGKTVETVPLSKWKENSAYEEKYGSFPPPPMVAPPPPPPLPPAPMELPENVEKININNQKVTVTLKDGKVEKYDLEKADQKAAFEKKYGKVNEPPVPPAPPVKGTAPTAPVAPVPPMPPKEKSVVVATKDGKDMLATLCDDFEITDKQATMHLRNGQTEVYDLTKTDQRRNFEKKFGRIISLGANNDGVAPVAIVNGVNGHTVLAPLNALQTEGGILAIDEAGTVLNGEEELLFTITKNSTPRQIEDLKKQMKEKGYELQFENTEYENGVLVSVSGDLKFKDSHAGFSATDFSKVILSVVNKNGRKLFKVNVVEKKTTI